jgi:hypothetical protein
VGEAQFPALIADESVQGFGILVHADAKCEVGKSVMLKTESGWSECRVMNIRLLDDVLLDEDDPESGSPLRVGLMRVKDIEDDNQQGGWREMLRSGPRKIAVAALGNPMGGAMVFTVLLFIVAGIVIWSLERPGLVRVTRGEGSDEMPEVIEPRTKVIVGAEDAKAPPRKRKKLGQTAKEAVKDVAEDVADLVKEIRIPRGVIRKSMPSRLLDPDVISRLSLDERQLTQLRGLLDEQEALDLLKDQAEQVADTVKTGVRAGEDAMHEQGAIALGQRVLEVLDDQQREEWEALLAAEANATAGEPAESEQKTSAP